MLIILSGAETIHKKFYAKEILRHFIPDFPVKDGYTANFKSHPYTIMDPEGKVVYGGENNVHDLLLNPEDGTKSEYGLEIMSLVQDIYVKTLLDGVRDNHFGIVFVDIEMDYGVDTDGYDWDNKIDDYIHPNSYQDVINNYRNKRFPVHVITGCFSKTFIDLIKKDIGEENVKAYNIIRNPSVVYLLNEKPASYYIEKPSMSPAIDEKKVRTSIVNSASLQRYEDIVTIRYEDVLESGVITIEGKEISMPEGYENYNGLITTWEKDFAELAIASDEKLNDFLYFCDHVREEAEKEYGPNAINFPVSIFAQLGYSALTREQVVAPKE